MSKFQSVLEEMIASVGNDTRLLLSVVDENNLNESEIVHFDVKTAYKDFCDLSALSDTKPFWHVIKLQ